MTTAPAHPRGRVRHAWVAVLVVGIGLFFLVTRTLVNIRNPNFVPTAILLGASVVPATFATFVRGRRLPYDVPNVLVVGAGFIGGVIGTVVAGTLESRAVLFFLLAFVGAVVLHALWDGLGRIAAYVAIAVVGLGLLTWTSHLAAHDRHLIPALY